MAVLTQRTPRIRHLRRRAAVVADTRLRRLKQWASNRSTDLSGTGTVQAFTADAGTDLLTISSHGHASGDGPFLTASTGTLPAGLDSSTLYWVNAASAGTLSLHFSKSEAVLDQNPVNITDTGSGTHALAPASSDQAIMEHARQGVSPDRLTAETDIDNLI